MFKRDEFTHGLILGMPGSGKTYLVKKEIANLLKEENTNVYIIDTCRDYLGFANEFKGIILHPDNMSNFINPFDLCTSKFETEEFNSFIIPYKSDLLAALVEEISGKTLNSKLCSILDKHLGIIYKDYFDFIKKDSVSDTYLLRINRNLCPTITDLCDSLSLDNSIEAHELLDMINSDENKKKYLKNKTNLCLPSDNKLFVYDIGNSDYNTVLEYYLSIADIWNRVIENKDKRINNYVYLEDINILLDNKNMQKALASFWKRGRKFHTAFTGIAQYAEDFGTSPDTLTILNNLSYLYILPQKRSSFEFMRKYLALKDEQFEQLLSMPINQGFLYNNGSLNTISF